MTPTWWPLESRPRTASSTIWFGVWTLGNGIGFGRYPAADGIWEGGHIVVTLDPNEKFCGCGGLGHLESIMGHRAMRLRFLDMEPEEVFAAAEIGRRIRAAPNSPFCGIARWAAATRVEHSYERPRQVLTSLARNARFVNCRVPEPLRAGHGENESSTGLRVRDRPAKR